VRDVELHVPYDKERVESAPTAEEVKALSPESERRLEEYYGVSMSGTGQDAPDDDVVPYVRVVRVWLWPE
jgi:hypothetical protein